MQDIKKTIAIAAIINNSKQMPIMSDLLKNLETICLLSEVNVIVDAVAICNSHIILNEPVELAPIIDELRTIPVFKNQSNPKLTDAIEIILKMRGLQCEFKKVKIQIELTGHIDSKGNYIEGTSVYNCVPGVIVSVPEKKELPKEAKITIKIKIKHV